LRRGALPSHLPTIAPVRLAASLVVIAGGQLPTGARPAMPPAAFPPVAPLPAAPPEAPTPIPLPPPAPPSSGFVEPPPQPTMPSPTSRPRAISQPRTRRILSRIICAGGRRIRRTRALSPISYLPLTAPAAIPGPSAPLPEPSRSLRRLRADGQNITLPLPSTNVMLEPIVSRAFSTRETAFEILSIRICQVVAARPAAISALASARRSCATG
jgi:hypothetical protein